MKGTIAAMALAAGAFRSYGRDEFDFYDLELRSVEQMAVIGPRICARLKAFKAQRPRPWRTWRGSQRTGKRSHRQ